MAIIIGIIGDAIAGHNMPGGVIGAMIAGFVGAWVGAWLFGDWGPVIGVIGMNKAETEYPVQSGSNFLKGVFIGGLLGAAAALLFAPKTGRELRGDLSDKLSVVTDKTKEVASVVTEKATDLAKTVSSKTTDLAKSVNESKNTIMESVKQASADVADDMKSASGDVADDVKSASKDVMDKSADASSDIRRELNKTSY
ncbi:hypothetical protein BGX30_004721 [Mortierella sp. GBA39]|nr:hypothetical protein BGX30_004721 [Mortierella sp. GBA39]